MKIRIQGFSEASSSENNGDAFIYREKSGVSPLKIDASLLLLLGLPELGMTRAEILTHNSEMLTLFGSSTEMLFQLLFAYMAAMYLAGSQLTKGQYAIANVSYLVVMINIIFSNYEALSMALQWGAYSGLSVSKGEYREYYLQFEIALRVLLVALSLWFGGRVRHPKTE